MYIKDFIWLDEILEKLERKHKTLPTEVEQVFDSKPHFRYIAKGRRRKEENVYAAYGQTEAGRFLVVFFIYKPGNLALIISARDMDRKERKRYG